MKKTAVKLKHINFNMKEHGFVGHLAEPEQTNGKAVIVIMGGEQSFLPGIKIAERFADYGFTGLAVSLFGAEGLPGHARQMSAGNERLQNTTKQKAFRTKLWACGLRIMKLIRIRRRKKKHI